MAINAEDDPFQPNDSIPKAQAERSSHLGIVTTKYGGHVGFVEGWIPSGYFWSDRFVINNFSFRFNSILFQVGCGFPQNCF